MSKKEEILARYQNCNWLRNMIERIVLPEVGTIRISEIKASDLERMYRTFDDRGINQGIRRYSNMILRRLCHMAMEERLLRENPVDGRKVVPYVPKKLHGFTEEQERALLRAFSFTEQPELYTLVLVAGIPFRELAACVVRDFSAEERTLKLEKRLTNKGIKELAEQANRVIPLSDIAVQIMTKWIKDTEPEQGLCLPIEDRRKWRLTMLKDMKIIREMSGLEGIVMRDIEHQFGIRAMSLGENPKALYEYLGNRNGQNVGKYSAVAEDWPEEKEWLDERLAASPERGVV